METEISQRIHALAFFLPKKNLMENPQGKLLLLQIFFCGRFAFCPTNVNYLNMIHHAIENQESPLGHHQAVKIRGKLVRWGDIGIISQPGGLCPNEAQHAQSKHLASSFQIVTLDVL